MSEEIPQHLKLYDADYFVGEKTKNGYDDYANCNGVLFNWSRMVQVLTDPSSVLDVGAAYGFVPQYFNDRGIESYGIEPSDFALAHADPWWRHMLLKGSLPDLPEIKIRENPGFDVVTCTEVLEHVPEELVAPSLEALAARTDRLLICLIMLEGPGADGDPGHICLKSRDWWEWQFTRTGLVKAESLEAEFNEDAYSEHMNWSGRIFVRARQSEGTGRITL